MAVEFLFQQALYTRLSGAALGVTGVYDAAPQAKDGGSKTPFPYIVLGATLIREADTQTRNGFTALVRIHTHSRSGSKKETKDIQAAIYNALHRSPLTIAGYNNFALTRSDTDCTDAGDRKFHGVCEYLAIIETVATV